MVDVREVIFPKYSSEVERELREYGINEVYSYGKVRLKDDIFVLGKGKSGIIALLDDKRVIKIRRTDSPKETMELEAKLQIMAYPASPKVYLYGKNFIVMEYINGHELSQNTPLNLKVDLLYRAKYLEDVKIEHHELSRPWKNVIVTPDRTYIIDYDSASIKEKAYNVTKILSSVFKNYELAQKYKRGEITLSEIVSTLLEASST
ncbi:MAG: serine/threonine protein kinase [Sulfolobaceae archaeon]|nr:serine/threonine protein kinase [Sulfolobaceae archaeon]